VSLALGSRVDALVELNHHAAAGALDDRINRESSGKAEWQRRTKPNNSFNRSGISLDVIVNLSHDVVVSRPVNSSVRFLLDGKTQESESAVLNLIEAEDYLRAYVA